MPSLRAILATAAVMALCLAGLPARLQAADTLTVTQASVGFGGQYKAGFWNPVRLTVKGGPTGAKGQLEVVIPDGDRVPVIYADAARGNVDLAANQEGRFLLYAKTGPIAAAVSVQLRSEQGVVWSQEITSLIGAGHPPTSELLIGIGPDAGLEAAVATIKQPNSAAFRAASSIDVADLPDRWWGYEGVDVVVLTTSDAATMDAISAKQRAALIQWVQQGGRLVLCAGARGDQLLAAGSFLNSVAPGDLSEVSPLRQGTGLEALAGVELPFEDENFQRNRPLVTRLKPTRGETLVDEAGAGASDRPLVIHAPYGFGEVVFVGLDLDHPTLASWPGRARLLARLITAGSAEPGGGQTETRKGITHLGFKDLSGQLRAALDQFPGVTMVNFTTVSILTVVFLLLVGPGDYFLLSRLGWPRHWTWISFPLLAALFAGVAWLLGDNAHGRQVRVNQAEIVDLDVQDGLVRGMVWAHVYSPATRHFDVQAAIALSAAATQDPGGWLAWQGLPGDALGGLESKQIALAAANPYRVLPPGDRPTIDGLPVQVASSKSLQARWWGRTSLSANARLGLGDNGLLAGEFTQPLEIELTDCLLIHADRLYRLGKVGPGRKVYIADFPPLSLEARLTEIQRLEGAQAKLEPTAWRQDSTDVARIMQMLMFHEAARGARYTGLTHHYLSPADLTPQVRLGRAILVGRASRPVVTLQTGNQPLAAAEAAQTWTWYRLLMPVSPSPPENNQP